MHDTPVTLKLLSIQKSVSFLKNAPKLHWKKLPWRLRGKTRAETTVETRRCSSDKNFIPDFGKKPYYKILDRLGGIDLKICPIFNRALWV